MLHEARAEGLRYVELTTDPDNVASQRVIEANGGVLVEDFVKPPAFGSKRALRYRVDLRMTAPNQQLEPTARVNPSAPRLSCGR